MHRGELITASRERAVAELIAQRLSPLSLAARAEKAGAASLALPVFQRVSTVDKILLTRHISVMLKAGMGISDIVNVLIFDAEKEIIRSILTQAKTNLERGQPLSDTFAAYPKFFPPVFVGLIRAGESSGTLDKTLDQLSVQIRKEHDLRSRTMTILIYPSILFFASIILIVFLFTFVVPRIRAAFLATESVDLPFLTKVVFGMSDIVTRTPLIPLGIGLGIPGFALFLVRSERGKQILEAVFWRFGITRNLVKKLSLARFCRTLGSLLQAGITVLEALDIAADSVGTQRYKRSIVRLREDVRKGLPLTDTFRQEPDFYPHLLTSMMAVGEKTGSLEDMLITVSEFYEEDADRILKNVVTLLEPALLLVMGFVVGSIALSILLPIYQLVSSLG